MAAGAMGKVTLLLLTYNRLDYAKETLRSALDNIKTTHPLIVHIADDGSPEGYTDELRELAGGYSYIEGVTVTDSERGGYGKNYNLAMQIIHQHSRYCIPLEDDWRLSKPLELDPLLDCLDTSPEIGCIRLGYLSYTQELRGKILDVLGSKYLVFDPTSEEPHIAAGHPRVEAIAWQKEVGPWPVGLLPGLTELAWCAIPAARKRVAWPMDLVHSRGDLFLHIGAERAY